MNIEELYKIYLENPNITTDSRNCPEHSIFFGIKGERFDGTKFGDAALQNGAAYAVTEGDTLMTLQQLASYHIEQMKAKGLKVIGITGTNGKTTTKELVSAVLQKKYNVLYTLGNFNNHLGVPLTLLRLRPEHQIAVVEMGANHPGEIKDLVSIVKPHFGLISSVGRAHLEGFGSFEGVIKTKGELYDFLRENGGKVFLNTKNEYLVPIAEGIDQIPYVEGDVIESNPFVKFSYQPETVETPETTETTETPETVQTQLIGNYNIVNLLAAVTVGKYFGVENADINAALSEYAPTNNRSQLMQTEKNTLIVDAYNANPTSMAAALDNFKTIAADKEKMVILGGMGELGPGSDEEHDKIRAKIAETGVQNVWLVGKQWGRYDFETVDDVIARLAESPIEGKLILIKGSNSQKLFKLPEHL
ncbi:MAG: UDP-N-acetylmuramoyl-tripeptide--D-alanyl-D-alanine ligase [Bacteroidaceae bacterium]|nr:UDP-N-acetylmuramoyl-tripeptide--D-alanyl-D-alanine ligase [Bacteroidaceae bacterium]